MQHLNGCVKYQLNADTCMGIINLDQMALSNGLSLSNCYISFTPGPMQFPMSPAPLTFSWVPDSNGHKVFSAGGTMYVHASKAVKDNGSRPIQTSQVNLQGDEMAKNVFGMFYSDLQNKYPNYSNCE